MVKKDKETRITYKQRKAFELLVENGGNLGKAMIQAGYNAMTAHTPQKLTDSNGWKALVAKMLPDDHLAMKHREFLDAPRIIRTFTKGGEKIEIEETDGSAVKALDMAYKIKGSYAPEKSLNLNINVDELRKQINDTIDNFRGKGILSETITPIQD